MWRLAARGHVALATAVLALALAAPSVRAATPPAPAPPSGETTPPPKERAPAEDATPQRAGDDTAWLTGVEEPATDPYDGARTAANVALFVPRNVINLLFEGMTAAAGLVSDRQLVPRVSELMSAPGGRLFVFPTMFVETGSTVSFGVRMIGQSRDVTTSFRVGYGIPEDVVVESRVRYISPGRTPFALTVEGLVERHRELEYLGVGQRPSRDPRNQYRALLDSPPYGLYSERKVRLITGLGVRLSDLFELLMSYSLTQRLIDDAPDAGLRALSQVFEPGSLPGASTETWTGYGELAARLDSRPSRGRPSPGVLVEGYLGGGLVADGSAPLAGHDQALMRTGGRVAGFIPIYRRTNILSPRLVLDKVVSTSDLALPFTELARQPDFRGFDTRRDGLSLLGSLDYSWRLIDFLGARIFFDAATVAPSLAELELEHFEKLRYAVGTGLDLYITSDDVGQLAISGSPEGVRVLFRIGVPSDHGDRQHRD